MTFSASGEPVVMAASPYGVFTSVFAVVRSDDGPLEALSPTTPFAPTPTPAPPTSPSGRQGLGSGD